MTDTYESKIKELIEYEEELAETLNVDNPDYRVRDSLRQLLTAYQQDRAALVKAIRDMQDRCQVAAEQYHKEHKDTLWQRWDSKVHVLESVLDILQSTKEQ
jgi:hypothetical protein